MPDAELHFDRDLYRGTAEFYDRFRPPYPAEVLDALRRTAPLAPDSRVVDLACGTGQIAFGLGESVREVVAIDQEPEFIEFGRAKAERIGAGNIRWIVSSAEVAPLTGPFDLVAIGNAFHRLHRDTVVKRLVPHLAVGGCIALCWSWSPWRGSRSWQQALEEVIERWVDDAGARSLVPSGWEQKMQQTPHHEILRNGGLSYEGKIEFAVVEQWTTDSLIGNIYSSSHLNERVLGSRATSFEAAVREVLAQHATAVAFEQDQTYAVEFARRTE